ncbi:molecular chaperone DnaJ [Telmatocola sphagniphila]|uniref:Chaperone protein DnaJ n=1 Tax=Telmatocola sphagniphila TaxID=1123043 RepID=A0A8E6B780_9BACT|nr:molecular chaperone DnaJ [Telmatocola sphagniphila]QVL32559.1 molecular chaperone DnaJ [Telmatocola sphagniphila]
MAGKRDYYEVLGVTREASTEIIVKAYRKLAREYHPDRNIGNKDAEHKFKEVNEAHEVLSNDEKRAVYDRYGHSGLEGGMGGAGFGGFGGGAGDVFSDLINGFFGGGQQRRRGPQEGRDIQMVLDVTLREAAKGIKKDVVIPRLETCVDCRGAGTKTGKKVQCRNCGGKGEVYLSHGFFQVRQACRSCNGSGSTISDPCPSCRGQGKVEEKRKLEVNIPAGVDTGVRLQLRGEGEAGDPGAVRGDLEIVIRVGEDPDFKRDGNHLITVVPITYSQAALGASIEIPTLLGKTMLEIPRGTQTHTELRVSGEGMPSLRGNRKGDLRVLAIVETPTKLTPRHEELLRELAGIEQKHVSPERKTFFDKLKGFFGNEEKKDED